MPRLELPMVTTPSHLHTAAAAALRIRITGTVVDTGDGRSGRYRQRWLWVRTSAGLVRVTAATTSRLGTLDAGALVDLEVTLTGVVDLTKDLYYGERARLLRARDPA